MLYSDEENPLAAPVLNLRIIVEDDVKVVLYL
jgi:hypothetical protein